jgi:uncharacterized protein YcfL
MKRFLSFLALTSFLLVACGSTRTPDLESTDQVAFTTTLAAKFGFRKVEIAGEELDGTTDDNNEIRMRLALTDLSTADH